MEPGGLLPFSQVSAYCPYPEPVRSNPYHHNPLPENPSYYYHHICARIFPVVSYSQVSPQKPVYASPLPIRATCPAHLILLDFVTRTILGEDYRLLNSSLFSFLHSIFTPSLLDPNILLHTLLRNPKPMFFPQCERPKSHTHTKQWAKFYFCIF